MKVVIHLNKLGNVRPFSQFQIESLGPEFLGSMSNDLHPHYQPKFMFDAHWDIPSAIRDETWSINSIPLFIDSVKGPKLKDSKIKLKEIVDDENLNNEIEHPKLIINSPNEKIEESKRSRVSRISQKSMMHSSSFDGSEFKEEIKDQVAFDLKTKIMKARRSSRWNSLANKDILKSNIEVRKSSSRLKSVIMGKEPATKELQRVNDIAKVVKNQDKPQSIEHSSNFSKLSQAPPPNEIHSSDISKISSILSPTCGCATILIVDDQIINRMILNEFGSQFHIISEEAENGKVALQMYQKQLNKTCWNGYRLILMDLNMPVMNGLKATQKILEINTEIPKPKIIAITGFTSEEEREKCFKVGMCDVKYKPISLNTFHQILQNLGNGMNQV